MKPAPAEALVPCELQPRRPDRKGQVRLAWCPLACLRVPEEAANQMIYLAAPCHERQAAVILTSH